MNSEIYNWIVFIYKENVIIKFEENWINLEWVLLMCEGYIIFERKS